MSDPVSDRLAALEQLDDEAFAQLLGRLPTVRAYLAADRFGHARRQPTLADAARLLASEYGVAVALGSCSALALQLTTLAAWHGGALTRAAAVAASGDLETRVPGQLDAAAAELADLLLTDQSRGFVALRPGVFEAIRLPGQPVRTGVQYVNSDDLARWLLRLRGGQLRDLPTRKPERVDLLEASLRDRTVVAAAYAALPPDARSAFDVLTDGRPHAAHELGVTWLSYRYGRRDPGNVVDALEDSGLVHVDRHAQTVQLWLDVVVGLLGGLVQQWPTEAVVTPAPLDHPVASVPVAVGRLGQLLDLWRRTGATSLRTGGIGVKVVRAAADDLGQPIGEVGLLASLAMQLGLLDAEETGVSGRGRNRVVDYAWRPNAQAVTFVARSPVAQWAELVRTWCSDDDIGDAEGLPTKVDLGPSRAPRRPAVERFLRELLALPDGTGLSLDDLTARCQFRAPGLLPPEQTAAFVAGARILGLVPASGPVGLLDAGRALLCDPSRLEATLSHTADRVIVQADLTIIAPPDLEPSVAALVERIAQLESASGARIYRLTERSLRRAFASGLDAEGIVAALRRSSAVELPATVLRLVDDVAAGHGRLRSGTATSYVVVDDPALLPPALKVRAARLRQIAPTVAVSDLALERVLAALRKAGVETVPDELAAEPASRPVRLVSAPVPASPGAAAPAAPAASAHDVVDPVLPTEAALRTLATTTRRAVEPPQRLVREANLRRLHLVEDPVPDGLFEELDE